MQRILLALTAIALIGSVNAQINYGGEPISWKLETLSEVVPFYSTAAINLEEALAQDAVTDQYKETPYRFGIEHNVDLDFFAEASATALKGDRQVWRLGIECRDAQSVSLLMDQFYLPEGSELYVYSEDGRELKGMFNAQSNKSTGVFPIGLIKSDRIIIEYIEPISGQDAVLHISQIVHGYRNMLNKWENERGPFGNSGACNINANCPEGLPWEAQKRSVALIVNGGFAACSGAMVNNTLQDETPYFLTANHCLGNPANWTYYFNHETAGCTGNTGPTDQSISGGTLRASGAGSDFALVELSANVPASFNVYYAGWDNSDAQTVTSAVGIHHPAGDLKKICFEDDAPYHNTAAGAQVWYIDEWEDGVTEGGSSGSPLFDQNGRVIGQLYGGAAACNGTVNNGAFDYYGRLGVSWDNSNDANSLMPWLDPSSSGAVTIDGFGPNDVVFANDVAGQGISNVPDLLCSLNPFSPTFTLRNAGSNTLTSATINYAYNGSDQTPINWTGSLAQGATESITLGQFTPSGGSNSISVTVVNPNGGDDENNANNTAIANVETAAQGNGDFIITILTDDYADETTWEVRNSAGGLVADGGAGYENNTEYEETVPLPADDCYTFTIFDSYGDGICCTYGDGSFSVEDSNGTLLLSGGEFSETDEGTVSMSGTSSLIELASSAFSIFPNPTDGVLNISMIESLDAYNVDIINTLGQTVMTKSYNGTDFVSLDLNSLDAGTYMVQVRNNTVTGVKRFTVK